MIIGRYANHSPTLRPRQPVQNKPSYDPSHEGNYFERALPAAINTKWPGTNRSYKANLKSKIAQQSIQSPLPL